MIDASSNVLHAIDDSFNYPSRLTKTSGRFRFLDMFLSLLFRGYKGPANQNTSDDVFTQGRHQPLSAT